MYYPRIVKNWGVGKLLKGICLTALSPLPVPLTPCYMIFRICKCQYSIKHKYYNVIQLLTDLRCIFLNIRYIFLIIKFYLLDWCNDGKFDATLRHRMTKGTVSIFQ